MNRFCGMILALALLTSASYAKPDPKFERDEAFVHAQDWQYTQILSYNYTTFDTNVSDVDHGDRSNSRDLQRDGWIAFFLYDYTVGRYTEQLLVGHERL